MMMVVEANSSALVVMSLIVFEAQQYKTLVVISVSPLRYAMRQTSKQQVRRKMEELVVELDKKSRSTVKEKWEQGGVRQCLGTWRKTSSMCRWRQARKKCKSCVV